MAKPLPSPLCNSVAFDEKGLVAVITQQHDSGDVLMMAWMNQDALAETIESGYVCYWSRSRGKLWRKGETSGQRQKLIELTIDCDGDTLLLQVDQTGVACHTGRRRCFYRAYRAGEAALEEIMPITVDPEKLYGK